MEDTSYEQAWAEGEGGENAAPATNAVKSAAEAARDAQAKEFAEVFFAEDKPEGEDTQVDQNAKADAALKKQAMPGDAPAKMQAEQSDEEELSAAAKKAA